MRGIDISAVGIVALLGISVFLGWGVSQLSTGLGTSTEISETTSQGTIFAELENTKRSVTQDIVFSAHQASLAVAAQGGSYVAQRYWMCGEPQPPEPEEVLYAMSEKTGEILEAYVNETSLKEKGIDIYGYDCSAIYEPGVEKCLGKDSSQCESFSPSAIDGKIELAEGNAKISYKGDLMEDADSNRFWWLYYNLYDAIKDDMFRSWVAEDMQADCPDVTPSVEKIDGGIEYACEKLKRAFDDYVEVECAPTCLKGDMSCLNSECAPPEVPPACYSEMSFDSDKASAEEKLSFQGVSGSAGIEVTITDNKFNIPGPDASLEPLVWTLELVTNFDGQECNPIN